MSSTDRFGVSGKTAVVTGGTGVLGGAMASGLAKAGVKVAVGSRSQNRANEKAGSIAADGGVAIGLEMDVADRASVESAATRVMDAWGRVDMLVNAAGGNIPNATASDDLSFFDLPAEALLDVMELNLSGTIIPSQVFGRGMAERGDGCIVNISSMAADRPLTRVVGYSAA